MDPTPEMKTVQHKTTMVLLECKLYETLHPETWDWQEICMASGTVLMPSESIKVVPAASGGGEGKPVAWLHEELGTVYVHPNDKLKDKCVPLYRVPGEHP